LAKILVILEIQHLLSFGVLTPLRQSVDFCPPEKNFTLHFLAFLSGFVHKVPIRTLPSKLACQYQEKNLNNMLRQLLAGFRFCSRIR